MPYHGRLFSEHDFPRFVRAAPEMLTAAVDAVPDAQLMAENVDRLIDDLVGKLLVVIPVLSSEKVESDEGEVQVDVSHDPYRARFSQGGPMHVRGTEYRFYVPFAGSSDVFLCRPSTFDFSPPHAEVRDNEIVIRVTKRDERQDAQAIRTEFEQQLAKIESYLRQLRVDADGLEERLRQTARVRIEQRRQKRHADAAIVDQIGFPKRGSRR